MSESSPADVYESHKHLERNTFAHVENLYENII